MEVDEFLIRTTIRMEVQTKYGLCTGTGFFFTFKLDEYNIPVIVTNKHVVKGGNIGEIIFSTVDEKNNIIEGKKHSITITEFEKAWIMHPDNNIDLCIMPIAPILESVGKNGIHLACAFLLKENMLNETDIINLSKIEDITVIGYPDGIWDYYNNLPIVRKGITATPICYNFENTPKFLIDAAIYGGSSGSPVFIYNQGSYSSKSGLYAGDRLKFVGIVYAVAQHTITGEMKIVDIPTINKPVSVVQVPNNLGVVIKAEQLNVFEDILLEKISKEKSGVD